MLTVPAEFGNFVIRSRAACQGRNPRTGAPVAIATSRLPTSNPAKALRDAVNEERGGTGPVPAPCRASAAVAKRAGVDSRSQGSRMFGAGRRRVPS